MNKTDQLPLQISLQKFENFYFNLRGRFFNPMNDKIKLTNLKYSYLHFPFAK